MVPDGPRSTAEPRTSAPMGLAVGGERADQLPLSHERLPPGHGHPQRPRPPGQSAGSLLRHRQPNRSRESVGERQPGPEQQHDCCPPRARRGLPPARAASQGDAGNSGDARRRFGQAAEPRRSRHQRTGRKDLSGSLGAALGTRAISGRPHARPAALRERPKVTRKTTAPLTESTGLPPRHRTGPGSRRRCRRCARHCPAGAGDIPTAASRRGRYEQAQSAESRPLTTVTRRAVGAVWALITRGRKAATAPSPAGADCLPAPRSGLRHR